MEINWRFINLWEPLKRWDSKRSSREKSLKDEDSTLRNEEDVEEPSATRARPAGVVRGDTGGRGISEVAPKGI